MGYDVHITRAPCWTESEATPISLVEWRRYVESDPEVERDPDNSPEDFLYVAHPLEPAPLWWHWGRISTKNPTKSMIGKMIEIARRLGARVQGDEDEFYDDISDWPG